jgi:hypothetical protein
MAFTVEDVLRARRPARPVLWACLNRRCARLRWVGPDSTCPTCGAEGGELLA